MGIGSWWKKRRERADASAMEREEERWQESPEERRITSGDIEGLEADEIAARGVREGSIDDADRLGDEG
jgi:hypothetical protein